MRKLSRIPLSTLLVLLNLFFFTILIPNIFDNANIAAFSGGDGSSSNPYQISTLTDLQDMNMNLSAHYILVNNIDASATATWNWNGSAFNGFDPVGNLSDSFTGTFDGKGYSISSLTINNASRDYVGLFGYAGPGAVFKNVYLVNVGIIGNMYIGCLVGEAINGSFDNCYVNGSANGYSYVGGLVGHQRDIGIISECSSTVSVKGFGILGSLVGYQRILIPGNIYIKNCSASGDVIGEGYAVGGLTGGSVATNPGTVATIEYCSASGDVTSSDQYYIGGLAGANYGRYGGQGIIHHCYASGNVSGNSSVGGLVGFNHATHDGGITIIEHCSASGNVTGAYENVGGLIGWSYAYGFENASSLINNCHATGNVICDYRFGGGLIGYNWNRLRGRSDIINCFATGKVTGKHTLGGLVGYSREIESGSYVLIDNCYASGDVIGNVNIIGGLVGSSGCYDLNYRDRNIIKNSFSEGNVSIKGNYSGGFIGVNQGTVINCHTDANTTVEGYKHVGGLIGRNQGIVTDCTANCSITGFREVGGLIGNNSGSITTCSADSNISGDADAGGLIGLNYGGSVTNSFSHSLISGDSNVGGLIGNNWESGTATNCYSIGQVSGNTNVGGLIGTNSATVTDCFWDNETSGQTTSSGDSGATGKYTIEMKKESTFTSAHWDFENIWGIIEGKTYPFFGPGYNPPWISTFDVKTATEDTLYYVVYDSYFSSYLPNNQIWSWILHTNASDWLSMDGNGVLSGIPTNDDVGNYWVNITVIDKYDGKDSHNFTLNVINVNDPPSIITKDNTTAIVDIFYSVQYEAVDIDPSPNTFTWSLQTNSSWLNINQTTGILYGTPEAMDVGEYYVNITVNDTIAANFTNFTITVLLKVPPQITTTDFQIAYISMLYSVNYTAVDPDTSQENLIWSMNTNATWLNFSGEQELSGTPLRANIGYYWINISVFDGDFIDFTNFTITVKPYGSPVIMTIDNLIAYVSLPYSMIYKAIDTDTPQENLTWSMNTNAKWLNFSSNQHLFGIPSTSDVGSYWVNIRVSDGFKSDFTNFTLTVSANLPHNITNPTIISTFPIHNDTNVQVRNTLITIEFSKPMNNTSVEEGLYISPPAGFTTEWYKNNTELKIILTEILSYGTIYKITITNNSMDAWGNNFESSFELVFSTMTKDTVPSNGFKLNIFGLISIAIVLILVTIIIVSMVIFNKRKKKKLEERAELEKAGRTESVKGKMAEEYRIIEDIPINAEDYILKLKDEALEFKKPSKFKTPEEKMLKDAEQKYRKGEISKTTYESIIETLLVKNG